MTIDKFFEQLRLVMSNQCYTPFVDEFGAIRIVDESNQTFCPLTLVCREVTGRLFEDHQADDASWALGMNDYEAKDIA